MNATEAADKMGSKVFPKKTTIVGAGAWLAAELIAGGMGEAEVSALLPDAIRIYCERRAAR